MRQRIGLMSADEATGKSNRSSKSDHAGSVKALWGGALLAAAALAWPLAPVGEAAVIISDTFTSTGSDQSNIFVNHRTPNTTDLPGTKWNGATSANTKPFGVFITADWRHWDDNRVSFGHAEGTESIGWGAIGLGTYNDSGELRISADLRHSSAGIGLGFWAALPTATDASDRFTGFTGLWLTPSGLTLYENGTAGTSVSVADQISFGTLSYDINLASGHISNVMYEGAAVTGLSSSAFTVAATEFTGLVSSGSSQGYSAADNFTVASVIPEPATLTLLAMGGMGMLIRRRRCQ